MISVPTELRYLNVGDKVYFSDHTLFYYILKQFTAFGIVFEAYLVDEEEYVDSPTWSYASILKYIVHHKTVSINSSEYIL